MDAYTTSRVLTMDYVQGTKITDLSPLARIDIDGCALAEDLCRAYLDQILVDGFFHADPHPGNLQVTSDGRLALLDLGMVARVDPAMQESLLKLLLAISGGHGQEAALVTVKIGTPLADYDELRFRREVVDLVGAFQGTPGERLQAGKILVRLAPPLGRVWNRPAPELTVMDGRCCISTSPPAASIRISIPIRSCTASATPSCAATC